MKQKRLRSFALMEGKDIFLCRFPSLRPKGIGARPAENDVVS